MAAAATGNTVNYGLDVSTFPDLDPAYAVRSDPHIVAEAIARRYITPRGGLFYDPSYGYDVRQFLNSVITPGLASQIAVQCEAEAVKDERVLAATVSVVQGPGQLATLAIHTGLRLATGPFAFVLTVGQALTQFALVFPNLT